MQYIEKRKIFPGTLRTLCIQKKWYTKGTNEEYYEFLYIKTKKDNLTSDDIVDLAEDIYRHSENMKAEDIAVPEICEEITDLCFSIFIRVK